MFGECSDFVAACRRGAWPTLAAASLVTLVALAPSADAKERAGRLAVASENLLSTREAMMQLRAGGNAVDAAVAAALVAGVASPTSSGIGGGGFAVVWLPKEQKAVVLDFREKAPSALDARPFERRSRSPVSESAVPTEGRGVLVGVPGEVKGLFELHRRYGKRTWSQVVSPAARVAKSGFAVGRYLAATLASSPELASTDAELARIFFPHGAPARLGVPVKNAKLAATLTRIAAEGPSAFYTGPVAADIVKTVKGAGGFLSEADLESYAPVERSALRVSWEGYDVYTMPPPSAGGLMLAETLSMLSSAELKKLGFASGGYQHLVAEVMRGAIADRMRYVGDPDIVRVDLPKLLGKSRLAARRAQITPDKTHKLVQFGLEESGTHHLVTADAQGTFVSLTTTVNRLFGAKLVATESGVVLNDQLDDFSAQKDASAYGLKQSPNRPQKGARPVSSMTPTVVVKDGQVVLALGGSGGMTIATNVTQLVLSRLAFAQTPEQMVKTPRFFVPAQGPSLMLEEGAPPALVQDLEQRGETVTKMPFKTSAVQVIAVENGRKIAASDPRKFGAAQVE